ncbi:MAG: invasion associated locus B family protein [Methyloceanibacter sp.]|uniref:invasion associated locus B family protein n=1 Tax=Methyloceanibacter sp. TaxID=1965321 RepID=UPI003D9B1ADB
MPLTQLQVRSDAIRQGRRPIISCDKNGCMAEYTATDAEVKSMLSGESLLVAVQARDQKPLSVNVPFAGFATAYSKLR